MGNLHTNLHFVITKNVLGNWSRDRSQVDVWLTMDSCLFRILFRQV